MTYEVLVYVAYRTLNSTLNIERCSTWLHSFWTCCSEYHSPVAIVTQTGHLQHKKAKATQPFTTSGQHQDRSLSIFVVTIRLETLLLIMTLLQCGPASAEMSHFLTGPDFLVLNGLQRSFCRAARSVTEDTGNCRSSQSTNGIKNNK